ncbi:SDR family NAD(P)-dependent oxidoreductase [Marisediminicola sp. LYQ85]|uniref:SDR family NAD(P)-dependent oxidoreductase n=1 Tax=Marisediminicola sp. LYQ85 TaxID=3391062 RepID=UPI0039831CE9
MSTWTIKGATVVITGASSGIGRGTALALADRGANLVLAARSDDVLAELARSIPNAIAVPTDVTDPEAVGRLAAAALNRFGSLDVWINCASVGAAGIFTDVPLDVHRRVIETGAIGVLNGSHVALRHFEKVGGGRLLNVGSAGGKLPFPFFSSYAASKFAVVGLGQALLQELEQRGVTGIAVSTVNPWVTDTPFFENAANYTGKTLRMPRPDDTGRVVDAIVRTLRKPVPSVDVGPARGAAVLMRLLPGTARRSTALVSKSYLDSSPVRVRQTSGNVHEPVAGPHGVDGVMRDRVKKENRNRRRLSKG